MYTFSKGSYALLINIQRLHAFITYGMTPVSIATLY